MNEWFKFSEQSPGESGVYLATCESTACNLLFVAPALAFYSKQFGTWHQYVKGAPGPAVIVTFWTAVPDPPFNGAVWLYEADFVQQQDSWRE